MIILIYSIKAFNELTIIWYEWKNLYLQYKQKLINDLRSSNKNEKYIYIYRYYLFP